MCLRDFLGHICRYPSLRDAITPNLQRFCTFLEKNPAYGSVKAIEIDYNLIEVRRYLQELKGLFFNSRTASAIMFL